MFPSTDALWNRCPARNVMLTKVNSLWASHEKDFSLENMEPHTANHQWSIGAIGATFQFWIFRGLFRVLAMTSVRGGWPDRRNLREDQYSWASFLQSRLLSRLYVNKEADILQEYLSVNKGFGEVAEGETWNRRAVFQCWEHLLLLLETYCPLNLDHYAQFEE